MSKRKMWTGIPPQLKTWSEQANWKVWLVGAVYFLVFVFLMTSGLFFAEVSIKLNEPSPQLIRAPWNKDIDNVEKWYRDRELAAQSVEPVYMADPDVLFDINESLRQAFNTLTQVAGVEINDSEKVAQLQSNDLFSRLGQIELETLVKTSEETISATHKLAQEIILQSIQDEETGAKSIEDVNALKIHIMNEIDRSDMADAFKKLLKQFVERTIDEPTLIIDEEQTRRLQEKAMDAVELEVESYRQGQKIVGQGEIVDEKIFNVLLAYGIVNTRSPWQVAAGTAFIVFLGMLLIFGYVYRFKKEIVQDSWNKLFVIGLTMVLVLFIGKGVIAVNISEQFNSLTGLLIPVAWATMSVAILVNVDVALITAVVLAVFVCQLVDPTFSNSTGLQSGLVALFGGVMGVHSVSRLSQRSDLARAGLFVAAINLITISGIALITEMSLPVYLVALGLGIINGIASSILAIGSLHWLETGFRITSGMRLLELSNPNRPLLKRLLLEAPGTYHHSILVGNLAEAASEAVGADSTLVRVGALYHDIGKLKRPYFFIENQFTQDNPHEKIAPTLSALIITSHVKDGVELAKEHKLPQPIIDIISQHHGGSMVSFFYHKALEENPNTPQEAFRYDTPSPQTKEAALVTLADSVEAAVRSMKQPTQGKIEGLVRKVIKEKLNEGVLDQCDLTLQDLDRIANAFVTVLSGIFHNRIEYPDLPGSGQPKHSDQQEASPDQQAQGQDNVLQDKGSDPQAKDSEPQVQDSATDQLPKE